MQDKNDTNRHKHDNIVISAFIQSFSNLLDHYPNINFLSFNMIYDWSVTLWQKKFFSFLKFVIWFSPLTGGVALPKASGGFSPLIGGVPVGRGGCIKNFFSLQQPLSPAELRGSSPIRELKYNMSKNILKNNFFYIL